MSLYTPNLLSSAPANLAWDGDVRINDAAAHPALLMVPQRVENLPGLRPGIGDSYLAPPPPVIAAIFARQWVLNCEIDGAGVSFDRAEETVDLSVGVTTWRQRFLGGSTSYNQTETDPAEPLTALQLSWSVNSLAGVQFGWTEGNWWPALNVFVQARNFDLPGFPFATAVVGGIGDPVGSVSPIIFTFCGEEIPLYYTATSPEISLGGYLKIDVKEWLDVV